MKRAKLQRCILIKLLVLLPALGLFALHASQPVSRRRRIMLELHDSQGDGDRQLRLPAEQGAGLEAQQQQQRSNGSGGHASFWQRFRRQAVQPRRTNAAPQFVGYTPSVWEQEWVAGAAATQADPLAVCGTMLQQLARSKVWVGATSQGGRLRFAEQGGSLGLDPDVFSRFTYRDPSSGEEYGVWIEPLVGHFRHPYNPAACVPPGMPPLPIQDRGYILLHGLTPTKFQRLYPGKKYLLDLGTADFTSSLGWFTEQYGSWGVNFDEIWAWEVENMPPQDYWSKVPADMLPRLHFYNIPVTTDATHADNPFNIIKSIYQPGDFVVVKLDIDNVVLESQLIEQIRRDPATMSMIAEMHFEMHYDHPDMALAFGHPNATWVDVAQLFGELRSSGLRLHYWP